MRRSFIIKAQPVFVGRSVWWQRDLLGIPLAFFLLLVRILNKLLSVPKSKLCFICVRGRSGGIYTLWTSTCSKGLIVYHTPSSTRHEEFRVSFRVSFHFERSPDIVYCFVFLSTHPPTLGDFVWCHRVAERFIRHIIGFYYCWFVFLINFSLCQKANYVLCVSEGVVGEFTDNRG